MALPVGGLSLVLHLPGGTDPVPCIVACRGLRASKDGDKYLLLGEACARVGLGARAVRLPRIGRVVLGVMG